MNTYLAAGLREWVLLLPSISVPTDPSAISLSSFGGEGQREAVVGLSQRASQIGAATRWNGVTNYSATSRMMAGLLSPTISSKGGEGEALGDYSRPPDARKAQVGPWLRLSP